MYAYVLLAFDCIRSHIGFWGKQIILFVNNCSGNLKIIIIMFLSCLWPSLQCETFDLNITTMT